MLGLAVVVALVAVIAWKTIGHRDPPALQAMLDDQVAYQRKLIVLFADFATPAPADAALGHQAGQYLFHANLEKSEALSAAVLEHWRAGDAANIDAAPSL